MGMGAESAAAGAAGGAAAGGAGGAAGGAGGIMSLISMIGGIGGLFKGMGSSDPEQQSAFVKLISNPEVLQAFGETTKNLGRAIGSADKIPQPAVQMLQQAMASGSGGAVGLDTFMGDAGSYIPPDLAATVLAKMGIPPGFTPMK